MPLTIIILSLDTKYERISNSPKFKKSHKKKLFKGRKGTSLAMYTTV